jgi:hypothetical protein
MYSLNTDNITIPWFNKAIHFSSGANTWVERSPLCMVHLMVSYYEILWDEQEWTKELGSHSSAGSLITSSTPG